MFVRLPTTRQLVLAASAVIAAACVLSGCGTPSTPSGSGSGSGSTASPSPATSVARPRLGLRTRPAQATIVSGSSSRPDLMAKDATARSIPPRVTPTPRTGLSSYATDAKVCSLIPQSTVQKFVPGGKGHAGATGGIAYCLTSMASTETFTSFSVQLSPTAKLGSFRTWLGHLGDGVGDSAVQPETRLGAEAVSIYSAQPNGLLTSQFVWRQAGYQIELRYTTFDPAQLPALVDAALAIHDGPLR